MDTIMEILNRAVEQLLGRASGPMHLRLLIQPLVATILAVRAGLRDARQGQPAFFWAVLTNLEERKTLIQSACKDIGKVFILAMALDTIYQLIALHAFHLVQTLIVAIVVAVIPYTVLRGPVTRLTRGFYRKDKSGPADDK
jgi:hypothetical protein